MRRVSDNMRAVPNVCTRDIKKKTVIVTDLFYAVITHTNAGSALIWGKPVTISVVNVSHLTTSITWQYFNYHGNHYNHGY